MEDHGILGSVIIVSVSETTNSDGDFLSLENNNNETTKLVTRTEKKKHDQFFVLERPSVDNHHRGLSS
jgi:ribosomal 30S subunit maturation factor RimM